jgi:hypothetical protein
MGTCSDCSQAGFIIHMHTPGGGLSEVGGGGGSAATAPSATVCSSSFGAGVCGGSGVAPISGETTSSDMADQTEQVE